MELQTTAASAIRETILRAVRERAKAEPENLAPEDDVFAKFGLNSMDAFAVVVTLERALDVIIGEDAEDFDRVATLGGLESLLAEKVQARNQAAGESA